MWQDELRKKIHISAEKERARELRKSRWWQTLIRSASCYYCGKSLPPDEVTMDHILPVSRGGRSTRGNVAPACKDCNTRKQSLTPPEWYDWLQDHSDDRTLVGNGCQKREAVSRIRSC